MKLLIAILSMVILVAHNNIPATFKSVEEEAYIDTIMMPYNVKYKKRKKACMIKYSRKNGIPLPILGRLVRLESSFNSLAVSPKGAIGMMQVMPIHHTNVKIKHLYWIGTNIATGCEYLRKIYNDCGNWPTAILGYNWGQNSTNYQTAKTNNDYALTFDFVREVISK